MIRPFARWVIGTVSIQGLGLVQVLAGEATYERKCQRFIILRSICGPADRRSIKMQQVYTRGSSISQGGCALGVLGLAVLLFLGNSQPAVAADCGPGSAWVDDCPTGTDTFQSEAEHGMVIFDNGFVVDLPVMTGPTMIFRGQGTIGSVQLIPLVPRWSL